METVINQTVGYTFHLKIERETRKDTGLKYPDKTVVAASIGGNSATLDDMTVDIKSAKATILKLLSEKEVKLDES